tara:strand:+ start:609 stop:827 length:219 start_codon:yes stop_codon:yes gene_type:complete
MCLTFFEKIKKCCCYCWNSEYKKLKIIETTDINDNTEITYSLTSNSSNDNSIGSDISEFSEVSDGCFNKEFF